MLSSSKSNKKSSDSSASLSDLGKPIKEEEHDYSFESDSAHAQIAEESQLKLVPDDNYSEFEISQSGCPDKKYSEERYVKFRIDIIDTGVGIEKENIPKLFIDFSKLEQHEKINQVGTGLGLSICKRIIEQMGGSVSVHSEVGVGTTFSIHLATKAMKVSKKPINLSSLKFSGTDLDNNHSGQTGPRDSISRKQQSLDLSHSQLTISAD